MLFELSSYYMVFTTLKQNIPFEALLEGKDMLDKEFGIPGKMLPFSIHHFNMSGKFQMAVNDLLM